MKVTQIREGVAGTFTGHAGMLIATGTATDKDGTEREMSMHATTGDYLVVWIGFDQYRIEFQEVFKEVLHHEAFMKDLRKRAGGNGN